MYTFEKTDDRSKLAGTSQIMRLMDGFSGEQSALVYGKVRAALGDPLYESGDLENQFSYVVLAKSETGENWYLHVYSGPSGPAIGGDRAGEGTGAAAQALAEHIQAVQAVDYQYEGYYADTASKITMGVKAGRPFYTEREITDADELAQMRKVVYGR